MLPFLHNVWPSFHIDSCIERINIWLLFGLCTNMVFNRLLILSTNYFKNTLIISSLSLCTAINIYVCIYMDICTLVYTKIPEIYRSKALNSHFPSHLLSLTYAPYTVYLRFILNIFNCSYTHYLCSYWEKWN